MEFRFSRSLDFSYLAITWTKIAFPFELVSLLFPFPLKIREIEIPLYVQLFNRFNPKKPYLWRWDSSIVRGWAVSQAENSKSRTNQSQALRDRISVGLRHQSVIFSLIPDVLRAVEEEGGGRGLGCCWARQKNICSSKVLFFSFFSESRMVFPVPRSTMDYAKIESAISSEMSKLTLCFFVKTVLSDAIQRHCVFSYAVEHARDILISIFRDRVKFKLGSKSRWYFIFSIQLNQIYYEEENSDYFPKQSIFSDTKRLDGPLAINLLLFWSSA